MTQSYLFEADHFGFRPVMIEDIEYFLMMDADPDTMSFFPGGARTQQQIEDKVAKYIAAYNQKKYGVFLVFELETGECVGRAGFGDVENDQIEVGYVILKKHWGKGFASRILKVLLTWAKENIQKNKIIAFTPVNHVASERVMQKAGMVFVKKAIMKGVDCVIYEYKL
jgi:ribosomal-protein-alanine N-acetyltransferase